jgi:hypothetical protein
MRFTNLKRAIADLKMKPSAHLDARVRDAINAARARRIQTRPGRHFLPHIWRFIMPTPLIRRTAAVLALAAIASAALLLLKPSSAFGLEDIIAAYRGVHYLHVKSYHDTNDEPLEFWIKSDANGNVVKARYFLPSTEDGAKLVTWVPGKAEVWFKSKHRFLTTEGPEAQTWLQSYLDNSQPDVILRKLDTDLKNHQAVVDIQMPADSAQPMTICVTNMSKHLKRVFTIDQQSHLVRRIESYSITNSGSEHHEMTTEYSDYNVPIDDSMFSLRDQLPNDVKVSDTLNQVTGFYQVPGITDAQAAEATAQAFFEALIAKDYKTVGSIWSGELESYAREEFSEINATSIVSIGAAVLQTNWVPRGYQVPCVLIVTLANGQTNVWKTAPFMRPGDNAQNPNRWHITGGVDTWTPNARMAPVDAKYTNITARQAAEAFFNACSTSNWDEAVIFWPAGVDDPRFDRMKKYLGGLQVLSLGEAYQDGKYPGWFVPYEIKLPPQEINVLVANTNAARRYVMVGLYDSNLKPTQVWEWNNAPEVLPTDDPCAAMTPEQVVPAYFEAEKNQDWTTMRKLTSDADVQSTRQQVAQVKKAGRDPRDLWPALEVLGSSPSPDSSVVYVKCRTIGIKKWNLAVRNDNPDHRFFFDGGL